MSRKYLIILLSPLVFMIFCSWDIRQPEFHVLEGRIDSVRSNGVYYYIDLSKDDSIYTLITSLNGLLPSRSFVCDIDIEGTDSIIPGRNYRLYVSEVGDWDVLKSGFSMTPMGWPSFSLFGDTTIQDYDNPRHRGFYYAENLRGLKLFNADSLKSDYIRKCIANKTMVHGVYMNETQKNIIELRDSILCFYIRDETDTERTDQKKYFLTDERIYKLSQGNDYILISGSDVVFEDMLTLSTPAINTNEKFKKRTIDFIMPDIKDCDCYISVYHAYFDNGKLRTFNERKLPDNGKIEFSLDGDGGAFSFSIVSEDGKQWHTYTNGISIQDVYNMSIWLPALNKYTLKTGNAIDSIRIT